MKITLCGSTRFHERYRELNAQLSKQGHVVYSVAVSEKAGEPLTEEEKEILDLVHLKKILESDCIVVIGAQEDGTHYVGHSTSREIAWAVMNGKRVYIEKGWDFRSHEVMDITTALENDIPGAIQSVREGWSKPSSLMKSKLS